MTRPIVKRDGTVELDGVFIGGVVRTANGMWMGFGARGEGSGVPVRHRGTAVEAVENMWRAAQEQRHDSSLHR